MPTEIEVLTEMCGLLRLIAEPEIARRDAKLRKSILKIVGRSKARAAAILLMDGTRTRAQISKQSGIDAGELTRLIGACSPEGLLDASEKHPKLRIPISANFLEEWQNDDAK
jgi:hypothetical protein